MAEIAYKAQSRTSVVRRLGAAFFVFVVISSCEGRRQQNTQTGQQRPNATNPKPSDDEPVTSGDTPAEGQNGAAGEDDANAQTETGLSAAELESGKAFVNGWDGVNDEIPTTVAWTMQNAAITGTPPSGTKPVGGTVSTGASGTYDGEIRAIIDQNCTSCHKPASDRANLSTFQDLRKVADDAMLRVIAGTMPKAAPLAQAQRDKMVAWQKAGYPESAVGTGTTTGAGTIPSTTTPNGNGTGNAGGDVEFRIRRGTGAGAWNTKATEVVVKLGRRFTIFNDDDVVHQLHSNGAPCQHGSEIQPGQSETCTPSQAFGGEPPLYDHGSEGKFYIRTE